MTRYFLVSSLTLLLSANLKAEVNDLDLDGGLSENYSPYSYQANCSYLYDPDCGGRIYNPYMYNPYAYSYNYGQYGFGYNYDYGDGGGRFDYGYGRDYQGRGHRNRSNHETARTFHNGNTGGWKRNGR